MDVLWSPPLDALSKRCQAKALTMAEQPELGVDTSTLFESGLIRVLAPGGRNNARYSLAAAFASLEVLAPVRPDYTQALMGAMLCARSVSALGTPQQVKAWRALEAYRHPPVLIVPDPFSYLHPALPVERDEEVWKLDARAACLGSISGSGLAVLFVQENDTGGPAAHTAFMVPGSELATACKESRSGDRGGAGGVLDLLLNLADAWLLGQRDGATTVMGNVFALHRLAMAAQAIGISMAIYNLALKATRGSANSTSVQQATATLAQCAARISSTRMALYETVRAADADEAITLQSATVALSACQCSDYVMTACMQILGDSPAPDLTSLQTLLKARQQQRSAVAGPEGLIELLAQNIHSLPTATTNEGPIMTLPKSPRDHSNEPGDRVSEILDAAAAAFTEQSYDATTLDYIGEAIGVTKGSIYYHYRSKADLFVAVYRRAMELNIETIQPIVQRLEVAAVDRIYQMAYAHSLQVMKHLSYQRVAVQGLESHLMSRVTPEQRASLVDVISLRDTYENMFVQVIKEAIAAGELPEQDAHIAVKPLFGAINWTTMWYRPREGETLSDREQIASRLARFVVSGLTQSYAHDPGVPSGMKCDADQ